MRGSFDAVLKELRGYSPRASDDMFGKVLRRVAIAAPEALPRVDLADGRNFPRPVEPLSDGSVSRAVSALLQCGMLEELDKVVERPGRPLKPLRLTSRDWTSIGIYVQTRHGHPTELTGALTGLDGTAITSCCWQADKHAMDDPEDFVASVAVLIEQLKTVAEQENSRVLGVAITLGGHVNAGTVIHSTPTRWEAVELANRLEHLVKLAVVVENDVNALGVGESYSHEYTEDDMAVIGVFEEGVGGALVKDGQVYRGGFGMAGEIGHLTVEYQPEDLDDSDADKSRTVAKRRSFSAPCPEPCGRFGHVDCLAPPSRIRSELGLKQRDFVATAATASDLAKKPDTKAERAFARAGRALGRALVSVITVTNPSRIVIFLPPLLGEPAPDTVAARYQQTMEAVVSTAFSTGAVNARAGQKSLTVKVIPAGHEPGSATEPDDTAYFMARESAWCVLDAFLDHAAGQLRPKAPESGGELLISD